MSYDDLMQRGREARGSAGKAVLHYLWPQLARRVAVIEGKPRDGALEAELARWTVRGEVRTRETFGRPHPDDFPGGLPTPREYPGG